MEGGCSIEVLQYFFFASGKADKHLCEAVLYELNQAALRTTDDPIRQASLCISQLKPRPQDLAGI